MTQHHLLIGPPGSGKSTFAQVLQQHLPNSEIVSTDGIRAQLYGDPTVQGSWPEIFAQVLHQGQRTIAAGRILIYDATNAKRPWRFSFLRTFLDAYPGHTWIGWHLTTPLRTCLAWNVQRERQVPEAVIHDFYQALHTFPPEPAEGMAIVQEIDPSQSTALPQFIQKALGKLPRQITNRRNATEHPKRKFHPYSELLAFERLLYLIKVLLEYPGAGQLRHSQADRLQALLGDKNHAKNHANVDLNSLTTNLTTNLTTSLTTDLEELSLLLSQTDPLYGDRSALIQNLDWLHRNGFLSPAPCDSTLDLAEQPAPPTPAHSYSDRDRFLRLMGTLRFMLHHPFYEAEGVALEALTQGLLHYNIISGSLGSCRDTLRKDIQLVFKPYGLLQAYRYKRGYFLGTGIFSHSQLLQLHQLLAGQAKSLGDPTTLDLFNTLSDRLRSSKFSALNPYPVRAVYNFTITNQSHLPSDALANTIDRLEDEIERGLCLELQRFAGVGRHGTESDTFFQVWPVQMVFHNIGWYLGYEVASGSQKGLLAFERLDRLFRGRGSGAQRNRKAQERVCQQLQQLFQASGGLFLGTVPQHQQQWLSGKVAQREAISVTLELWCNDRAFRFISEGDQRFPPDQIQLSPRLPDFDRPGHPKIFSLKPTADSTYPHRLQVQLPYWAIKGVELQRWILGFKTEVRLISPPDLVRQFAEEARAIDALYNDALYNNALYNDALYNPD